MTVRPWMVVTALLLIFYGDVLSAAAVPIGLALIASALMEPPVKFLETKVRLPRGLAVFIVMAVFLLLGGILLFLGTAKIVTEVADFINRLPEYRDTFTALTDRMIDSINQLWGRVPPSVVKVARQNVQQLYDTAQSLALRSGQGLLNAVKGIPSLFGILLVTLLATFFLTKDRDRFFEGLAAWVSPEQRNRIYRIRSKVISDVFRYLRAQLILISMTTFISTVGLLFIGADNWLLAGMTGGMLDLLPILGPGLLFIPWGMYAIFTGSLAFGIKVLILFAVVSAVRQLFEAKVTGDSIGVHPLITLLAIYVGVVTFGVKGIIIAPMAVIFGKAIWESGIIGPPHHQPD